MKSPAILLAAMLCAPVVGVAAQKTKNPDAQKVGTATFCGGCFWCMQPAFDKTAGVISTTVGYTGGSTPNPTYREVSSHKTGHCEAIQVVFDPAKVSYRKLLDVYWKNIDPTAVDRQFVDVGSQYRTVIFYGSEAQKQVAQKSRQALAQSGRYSEPIATKIESARTFYPAEEYHQKFYLKNKLHYQMYHEASGRDSFFRRIWGNR